MALIWDFKTDKIGHVVEHHGEEDWKYNLYTGNALAIMLCENEEDDTYCLHNFFGDAEHAKNCLGLNKGYNNMYVGTRVEFYLYRDLDKYRKKKAHDLAALLTKAEIPVIWIDKPNEN